MNPNQLWERYRDYLCVCSQLGVSIDVSRMSFPADFFEKKEPQMRAALQKMQELENGAVANPDENRQVGHYWLRAPHLAPGDELGREIDSTLERIRLFASNVHEGRICTPDGDRFSNLLLLGIGGSALGPQLVSDALGSARDRMRFFSCDNTDPDGYDRTFDVIAAGLHRTLTVVISKSGGTVETRNALTETAYRYEKAGLKFPAYAVAVTQEGSKLHERARVEGWLADFPMWDWVGGRTSETSAVGLLPAALQGFDIDALLEGARLMDECTRNANIRQNPAALLALMWHHAADGRGAKDMVVIPYKDRLALFSKYLQQLVMESLGKETDLDGNTVHQGLTVYGNKGSTDQHAYVQQLRDGVHNFFVTFLGVNRDRLAPVPPGEESPSHPPTVMVDNDVTSGDYLHGFLLGTRDALYEKGRESMTVMLETLNARTLGAIIALYERAVGLYAHLVNINAYHQPGVEAGKKAAAAVIDLQRQVLAALRDRPDTARTAIELAESINQPDRAETVHHILEHLSANEDRHIERTEGDHPWNARYRLRA